MRIRAFLAAATAAALAFACAPQAAYAAAGVQADVTAGVAGSYAGVNDLGSVSFAFSPSTLIQFSPGTTTGKADKLFSDQRTLAASATENLDLAAVLVDPLGGTLTFGHVKAIYIHAAAANTNDVCVGGAGTNTFVGPFADATDVVCVKPGGVLLLAVGLGVGWTVTPATGDILKVANSAGTTGVTYDVVIVGTST
jgi:hypothetical protein